MTSPEIVWVHPLNLTGYPRFDSLAIGDDGSIYSLVETFTTYEKTGTNQYPYGGTEASFLIHYNPADGSGWSQGTVSTGGGPKLNVSPDGAVYVVRNFSQPNSWNWDVSITRFNANGSQAWSEQLGGAAQENFSSLASTPNSAIYVAGATLSSFDGQTNSGQEDGFLTRFNSDGTKAWTKFMGGAGHDSVSYLSASTDGSIFVSGVKDVNLDASNGNVSGHGFIARYRADGSLAWSQNYAGEGFEGASALTSGIDGEVYVGELNIQNIHTIEGHAHLSRYNADGSKAWSVLVGDGGTSEIAKVICGSNGAIYVLGVSVTSNVLDLETTQEASIFYARYNQDGTQAWSQSAWVSNADGAASMATSEFSVEGGSIYATGAATESFNFLGTTVDAGSTPFIFKLKFDEPATGNHSPTGAVSITKRGHTLVTNSTLADVDGLGVVHYQWKADGINITDATTSSLPLSQALVGKNISVVASYTDGGGTLERVTSGSLKVPDYNTAAAEKTTTVTTLTATDALLGTAPKYTLTGADAPLFKISNKGVLTFAAGKDYEQPEDSNKDGIYEVSVTMTNTKTKYAVSQDLTVGVEFTPINGTAGADTLKGTAGFDTLDGLAGDDKLTGGTGLDTFLVTSGHDTILDFNALAKGATGSEILQVSAGAVADATLKAAWTATSDSFNDGTANLITKVMAVDLTGITHGQGWNVTNAGAATTIKGSQFNDVLTGGSGNDILLGGAGNDVLIGGKGADTLTGGSGADSFRLSGDTKTDHITDFLSGTDRIELDHLLYKALSTGQLAANQFAQGTAATTTTQRIVYDQPTGNLWYDADGSGKGKAVLIAVLDNHVQIAHTDLYLI